MFIHMLYMFSLFFGCALAALVWADSFVSVRSLGGQGRRTLAPGSDSLSFEYLGGSRSILETVVKDPGAAKEPKEAGGKGGARV